MTTKMIKVHNAEIQLSENFEPEVLFTATFPLVRHGTHILETVGLTEEEILQKLAKVMLEQVFATINENKQKYLIDGVL